MSYNISTWKIRDIHLVLPLDFNFFNWLSTQPESVGKKWCMQSEDRESDIVPIKMEESMMIIEIIHIGSFLSNRY